MDDFHRKCEDLSGQSERGGSGLGVVEDFLKFKSGGGGRQELFSTGE